MEQLIEIAHTIEGQLTATIHGTSGDLSQAQSLVSTLRGKVGRVIFQGYPTGVEVCPAMTHGGPYPATMLRFARPITYQNCPGKLLPDELINENPMKLLRLVNGQYTRDALL